MIIDYEIYGPFLKKEFHHSFTVLYSLTFLNGDVQCTMGREKDNCILSINPIERSDQISSTGSGSSQNILTWGLHLLYFLVQIMEWLYPYLYQLYKLDILIYWVLFQATDKQLNWIVRTWCNITYITNWTYKLICIGEGN